MSVKYINRRNEAYYLKLVPTKTGKKQYYAVKDISKINQNDLAEEIPSGFEFHESPVDARVVFRKIPVYNVSNEEVEIIDLVMKKHKTVSDYIIEKGINEISIYISQMIDIDKDDILFNLKEKLYLIRTYENVLKFKKTGKIYKAQRFCYRSSSYDWITIGSSQDLRYLAEKYCYHIDKDSLFEFGREQ